jgi:hypothetical protein
MEYCSKNSIYMYDKRVPTLFSMALFENNSKLQLPLNERNQTIKDYVVKLEFDEGGNDGVCMVYADKYSDFLNGYTDISYSRFEQLYTWFEDGIADAKEELLTWFQNRLDIDYGYMLDEFIYLAEDGFFDNMDFDPEQNVLTETVIRKIA